MQNDENLEADESIRTIQDYERQMYHMDIRYIWNWSLLRDFQY